MKTQTQQAVNFQQPTAHLVESDAKDGTVSHSLSNSVRETNLVKEKDVSKIVNFLMLYDASSLEISINTGIKRGSVCFYLSFLEKMNLAGVVRRMADPRTGRYAKIYSCRPERWHKTNYIQLRLWEE